jgi:hypothetical protein
LYFMRQGSTEKKLTNDGHFPALGWRLEVRGTASLIRITKFQTLFHHGACYIVES